MEGFLKVLIIQIITLTFFITSCNQSSSSSDNNPKPPAPREENKPSAEVPDVPTPPISVPENAIAIPYKQVFDSLEFIDDLNFSLLNKAIERQLVSYKRFDMKQPFSIDGRVIKRQRLKDSLIHLRHIISKYQVCKMSRSLTFCKEATHEEIKRSFDTYRPIPLDWERGYNEDKTFFTAYYSPDLEGSKTKTAVFKNPIYAMPEGNLRYLTRDQIDFQGKLKGKGLELFYVKDSVYDIWLLHVEGGGRVKVKQANGKYKYYHLSYAGTNKKKFRMLYPYMIQRGMLRKGEASIAKQRAYFDNHPEDHREILKQCPSYVYFKVTRSEPLGVRNIPLTPNRSLATDYRTIKEYGFINFIKTKKPVDGSGGREKVDFSRFFINQDTGGAIKGHARVDLYFGYGRKAETAANFIHGLGDQYILILKDGVEVE